MNLVLNPEPEQQPARLQPPKPIRWPFAVTAIGAALFCLGYLAGSAKAAEIDPPRTWQVFDVGANRPWVSGKTGLPATATGPTACNLALHEVAIASPKGTRLACVRVNSSKGE